MYDVDRGDRSVLRAKLLLGVASATAAMTSAAFADQAPATPPSEPDKWVPYVDIGGGVGSSMTAGKADAFVPIWQDLDSLLFLNLGIGTETKTNQFESFTAGYRSKINSDWILGGYVGFDSTQLQDTNTFNQTALGAELMSADWDVRLNGYLAANEVKGVSGDGSKGGQLYINGTTIAILDAAEVGYTGFDGEVGYRVFSTDDVDVRFFVGGFFFSHSDDDSSSMGSNFSFGYRDIAGPKGRAEATLYDLDLLGPQSRLSVDGEIAHDDVRGTTGFIGATLRIPLGDFGGGAQALDELDRRMIDPERRNDTVLTRAAYTKPEPVIIYGPHVTSQPTNTLLYVDNTVGAGTYANPTTFADAASRATNNAFIVLTSKQGPVVGGATLQAGQTVVAGGETFTVEGEFSHTKFTHLFDPSTNVTVVPSTAGGNVITLANDTSLYGFGITGDFGSAVYGKNVTGINLTNLTIDGTGGGVTGININRTESGDQTVNINNVAISNVTNDGVLIHSYIADGGTSNLTTTLNDVTVTNAGYNGIEIDTTASNGSKITSAVAMSNITVNGAGYTGVYIANGAYNAGSSVAQTIAISNAIFTDTGAGIGINDRAYFGGHVSDSISLSNISVSDARYDGLYVVASAYQAGSVINQTTSMSNVTITSPSGDGIYLDSSAGYGASVTSNTSLSNVTITGAGRNGIEFQIYARGAGASVNDTLSITNATITNAGSEGIESDARARYYGALNDTLSITNATITDAGSDGINLENSAYNYGTITANETLSGITITGAGADGIVVEASAKYGATIAETLSIKNTTITNTGNGNYYSAGISISAEAEYAGSTTSQNITLDNVNVSYTHGYGAGFYGTGVRIGGIAYGGGHTAQYVTITGLSSTHNALGLYLETEAIGGSTVTTAYQKATITGSNFSYNTYEGVQLTALSFGFGGTYSAMAATTQNVSIYNTAMNHNGTGIDIDAAANGGASTTQNVLLYGVQIEHNAYDGVDIGAYASSHAFTGQTVEFNNAAGAYNEIAYNGGFGIYVRTRAYEAGEVNQHLYVYSTNVDHNATGGIAINNVVGGYLFAPSSGLLYYSHLQQNMVLAYGSVSNNGGNGINIYNAVNYVGSEDQFIELYKETVEHNAGDGFSETSTVTTYGGYGYSRPTNLHSNVYIYNSNLSYNGGHGISITSSLKSPTYHVPLYGYSYLEQHITVSGVTASHDVGDGFYAAARDRGVYGDNIQYITISGSTFDYNGNNGAHFVATQYYGPGGFGDAIQDVTISNSDFSHNTGNGLYAYAGASGQQGRAEQHFTVGDSTFNYNGANGIYLKRVAQSGTYVSGFGCDVVQGLTGGCAFVRSTFDMTGGSASGNTLNGIYVNNYARGYSAIYSESGRPAGAATVYLNGVTVDNNGANGLYVKTTVRDHSYAYSYVVSVGSTFDHNGKYGFLTYATVGGSSSMVELNKMFSYKGVNSASYNGYAGVAISDDAYGGSTLASTNVFVGLTAQHNGYDGVVISGYGDGASHVSQSNYFYYGNLSANLYNGVTLRAFGSGIGTTGSGFQYSKFGSSDYPGSGNVISHNGTYGVTALSLFGAAQYINIYTGGNTVTANTAGSYDFESFFASQSVY